MLTRRVESTLLLQCIDATVNAFAFHCGTPQFIRMLERLALLGGEFYTVVGSWEKVRNFDWKQLQLDGRTTY